MRKRNRQIAPTDEPNPRGFSDDMNDPRQIVELRPDPAADLPQLLVPVTVRIHGPADMVVVIARRRLYYFF